MSLPLVTRFGANPLLDLELANKQYVDTGGGAQFARVVKLLDETVADNTLQNDDELFIALRENREYYFQVWLKVLTASSTPDIKEAFSVQAGATGGFAELVNPNYPYNLDLTDTHTQGITGGVNPRGQILSGVVHMGGTAGNLQLQWAQNTTSAPNPVTLEAGTLMVVWESL